MAKLLIVDDIQDNVKLLSYDLQDMGHEVLVAYSGQDALAIAESERPDCILLDVMMPVMDGYEVCRRLKSDSQLRSIPVIMVSAGKTDEDVISGLDAGADDYVSKPFNVRIVESRVRSALRAKQLHDDLQEAKMAAEAANRSKSEFLSNMSHEIRSPMAAILGFTEILGQNLEKPENLAAIDTITRNGEHLLQVLNDILDLSKIEAGKLEMENIGCQPCDVVADMASLMRVRAVAKGLSLDVEHVGPIPQNVCTDPTRLRQILLNLVGNAIKFTEEGSVRIVTQLVETDTDHPDLQVEVVDSGIGMDEKQTAALFTPFMQADTSTTRKYGGTGLGLAISQRLAGMLGGEITVDAKPGEGCTFRLTVSTECVDERSLLNEPFKALSGEVNQSSTRDRDAAGQDTPDQASPSEDSQSINCRVLVAEDEPDNQRLISFILTKAGADVTVVENGQLAVQAAMDAEAANTPFDIILMDMQMPVLDGYDATRQLRKAGYEKPIAALTAHAMSSDQEKCLAAGCDHYMTKPFKSERLLDLVRGVIGAQENPVESPVPPHPPTAS